MFSSVQFSPVLCILKSDWESFFFVHHVVQVGFKMSKVRRNMMESGGMETCRMMLIQFIFLGVENPTQTCMCQCIMYLYIWVTSDPRDCFRLLIRTQETVSVLLGTLGGQWSQIFRLHIPTPAQILNIVEQTRSWRGKKEPLFTPFKSFNPFSSLFTSVHSRWNL